MITVVFEETGEEREVKQICSRCEKLHWVPISLADCGIISPRGFGHMSADYGMTLCGIDATGDKWWHRG